MRCLSKFLRSVGLVVCVLACGIITGCIKNEVLIKVKGDGSGNIVITRVFSKQAVAMYQIQMEEMKKHAGNQKMDMPDDPFYNEKILKKEAGKFGPGVAFVKAQKYDKEGAAGSVALYEFKDINEIFVNMRSLSAEESMGNRFGGGVSDDEEIHVAQKEDDAFEFKLVKGPESQLKIIVPDYPAPEPASKEEANKPEKNSELDKPAFPADSAADQQMKAMIAPGNPFGFTGKETQGEAVQKMLKGMTMNLAVETDGEVKKATATYRHKTKTNRFVLLDMDMDKLMTSSQFTRKLAASKGAMGGSSLDFFAMWQGIPGMTLETNKEVTITFKSETTTQPSSNAGSDQKKQQTNK